MHFIHVCKYVFPEDFKQPAVTGSQQIDACMAAGRWDGANSEREPQSWGAFGWWWICSQSWLWGWREARSAEDKIVDLKSTELILYKCQNKVLNSISMFSPSPPLSQPILLPLYLPLAIRRYENLLMPTRLLQMPQRRGQRVFTVCHVDSTNVVLKLLTFSPALWRLLQKLTFTTSYPELLL